MNPNIYINLFYNASTGGSGGGGGGGKMIP
jgi:hypothetical protein